MADELIAFRSPINGGILRMLPSTPPAMLAALEQRGFVRIEPVTRGDAPPRRVKRDVKKGE